MVRLLKAVLPVVSTVTMVTFGSSFLQLLMNVADEVSRKVTLTNYPPDRTREIQAYGITSFDFVIVGCGSAGSVMASRLSENGKWTVLVIEAGHDPYFFSEIPAAVFVMQSTDQNYAYIPEFQSEACLSMKNQVCEVDKGKVVGGTSVINAMLYVPGNKKDYDLWAAAGNEGWSYEEVQPYFKKSQQMQPDYIEKHGTKDFGAHGPLVLRKANSTFNAIEDIILSATAELGYKTLEAFPACNQSGFGKNHQTMENGRRVNVAKAYLGNRICENLYLIKGTRADRIIIEDNVATGVVATLSDGSTREFTATKEVIVCAGGVATPQLLMLSGIGPSEHLEEMGIPVIVDAPVGKNLQDHVMWLGPLFTYRNDSRPLEIGQLAAAATEYVLGQTGFLAALPGVDLMGFFNTDDPADDYPNIEIIVIVLPKNGRIATLSFSSGFGFDSELIRMLMEHTAVNDTILIGSIVVHPKSVGEIKLKSPDPSDPPQIFNNYLVEDDDVDTYLKVLDFYKSLAATDVFIENGIWFTHLTPAACELYEDDSRDYWECNLRHTATTLWHHTGTAKMGPENDTTAVVDPQLRVYGIKKLRVVDASIMPNVTSGNNNAPTVMVAEKAADMVKETWTSPRSAAAR